MKNLILKNSTGIKVLIFFIAANLVYAYMVFISGPHVMQFSNGIKILDLLPGGYDLPYVKSLFDILGEEGRYAYLYKQIPPDMIYPLLFAISSALLLAYFLKKLNKQNSAVFNLVFIPVLGGIADYAENIGTIWLLVLFPDLSETAVRVNSVFTVLKSSLISVYFLVLIVVLVLVGINYFFRKK